MSEAGDAGCAIRRMMVSPNIGPACTPDPQQRWR